MYKVGDKVKIITNNYFDFWFDEWDVCEITFIQREWLFELDHALVIDEDDIIINK